MTEDNPYSPTATVSPSSQPLRKRWLFFIGFAVVFVGMLLLANQYFYTGQVLVRCRLWQFYVLEIQRAFTSSRYIGPTSGSGTQALIVLLHHVVASSVGGLLTLGVGALLRRSRA